MKNSLVIVDEGHLLFERGCLAYPNLLEGNKILALGATFGEDRGLRDKSEMLQDLGAITVTMNPKTKEQQSEEVCLKSINFDFGGRSWKKHWEWALLEQAYQAA